MHPQICVRHRFCQTLVRSTTIQHSALQKAVSIHRMESQATSRRYPLPWKPPPNLPQLPSHSCGWVSYPATRTQAPSPELYPCLFLRSSVTCSTRTGQAHPTTSIHHLPRRCPPQFAKFPWNSQIRSNWSFRPCCKSLPHRFWILQRNSFLLVRSPCPRRQCRPCLPP